MSKQEFGVVVVGAGMGGICAAEKLRAHGFTPVVLEKASEVGGTWRDNHYPGLFVDIPVGLYQIEFAKRYDWTRAYAPGPEIQDYLVRVTDESDLRKHITFGVEITSAAWLDGRWTLRSRDGREFGADAVVAATGFLRVPKLPVIDGMADFNGRAFHSSHWPEDLDVTGKRIAVIGTGSSGVQLVAALSARPCQVTQYVRTPQWIETIRNPHANAWARRIGRRSPRLGKRLTERLMKGIRQDPRLVDPSWKTEPGPKREAAQQALREDLLEIRDPALRAALTPDFPPGCKRIPKSPTYYKAVQRPNVRVVRRGVERLCARGVVAPDGSVEPYDVIVYATGFDAHAYARPMTVTGVEGISLEDTWGDGPFSFRGVAVPGFPNFFLLNGPFSPVANVTIPKTLDDELGWICRVLERSVEDNCAYAPSAAATEAFLDWVGAALPNTVWFEGCENWYRGSGRRTILWPWLADEQTEMFRDLGLEQLDPIPSRFGPQAAASRAMA